jgi:Protein of unknown function (DUF2809)
MRRAHWASLATALFIVECAIATRWRQVPFVRADLGDYLVVILMYAGAKSFRPFRATPLALSIFAVSVLIECAQGIGIADRLGFARGSIASIVLGNTFSGSDIAMYACGCASAWLLDRRARQARLGSRDDTSGA